LRSFKWKTQGDKFRGVAIGPFGYGVKLTNDGFVGLHDVGSHIR